MRKPDIIEHYYAINPRRNKTLRKAEFFGDHSKLRFEKDESLYVVEIRAFKMKRKAMR